MDILVEQQAEVEAETVGDTLGNDKAYHCLILWLKGKHKWSPRHIATQ